MKNGNLVTLIIETRAYQVSKKLALETINLAKSKFKNEGVNAIVAVEKLGIITLRKDVYDDASKLREEVDSWTRGGYTCYYVQGKGK